LAFSRHQRTKYSEAQREKALDIFAYKLIVDRKQWMDGKLKKKIMYKEFIERVVSSSTVYHTRGKQNYRIVLVAPLETNFFLYQDDYRDKSYIYMTSSENLQFWRTIYVFKPRKLSVFFLITIFKFYKMYTRALYSLYNV
jgi:hypothetical protein